MRHLQARITHFACLLAEDGAQQTLLGGLLGLALRSDLAHEHVTREYLCAHTDDAICVQVANQVFGDVRNLAGDFLGTKLRIACIDLVLGNVNGREQVLSYDALGNDDSVLVVVTFPRHVGNHEVLAQGQLAMVARRAVSQHVASLDAVVLAHDRAMVNAAGLVGALEFRNQVLVVFAVISQDNDGLTVNVVDYAGVLRNQDFARVNGNTVLDARADERCRGAQQRNCLALHVRAHERTVSVVVLQERNERSGHRRHLARRYVHVLNVLGRNFVRLAKRARCVLRAAQHALLRNEISVFVMRAEDAGFQIELFVCLGDGVIFFFISRQVVDLVSDLAINDATIRRLNEAIGVDASVCCQRTDEADVGTFRRLDGAHTTVMRCMNVANLEACAFAGKAARTKCGKTALVRNASSRVRLVHELRKLRRTEELLDGGHNRADVHQALRRNLIRLLHAHALTYDTLHARKADAELVLNELAYSTDATVAEMVNVVSEHALFTVVERRDVAHGLNDVFLGKR